MRKNTSESAAGVVCWNKFMQVALTVLYALQMMVIITSTKEAMFSPWKLKLESNLYTP